MRRTIRESCYKGDILDAKHDKLLSKPADARLDPLKASGVACVVLAGCSMICRALLDVGVLKGFPIGLGFSIGSVIFILGAALIGEVSPPTLRGAMLGITNSIHTLAGSCTPFVHHHATE